MSTDLRVAVAGATGALGGEIIKVLDQVSWRPSSLVPMARATTSVTHIDYGDERIAVDDISDDALDGVDLLFLALPSEAATAIGEAAIRLGIPTIDCSGAFAEHPSIPLVVPWVNPEVLMDLPQGAVATPDPSATLLASALGPLRRAGMEAPTQAVVLVPASIEGKNGIEELSRQVVALFNSGSPPRKIFPNGLAFDTLPAIGALNEDGWTQAERTVAAQVARVTGISAPIDVTLVGVPVFSGLSAHLSMQLTRAVTPELILRILADGGMQVPEAAGVRYLPRPRRVEGKPFAHVGRVRTGADGRTLHLWLSMDNLRTAATVAVASAGTMLRIPAMGVQ